MAGTALYSSTAGDSVKVSLANRSYDILIKPGLVQEIGPCLTRLGFSGKVAVVTDRPVARLYAAKVLRSLKQGGFRSIKIVLPGGERAKTLRWAGVILDELVRARFERGSMVLALGGGVVGDMAGFAASIYVRGIPIVQVPTTLVAQVDSSVGGKTGVNHALGKNLIGTFHQPSQVLIDPETLGSLPRRELVAGIAEVIKYGMIYDDEFFTYLEHHMRDILNRDDVAMVNIIRQSCQIKAQVVAEDERESDRRRILNYGHTIGHALEALGKYRSLIHGEAVAIGMVQEAALARCLGLCAQDVVTRLRALVRQAGLKDTLPSVTGEALWGAMKRDKKVVRDLIHCVLPERIGQVVVQPLEQAQFKTWFQHEGHRSV